MNFFEYQQTFEQILSNPQPSAPYDDEFYRTYTQLNESRMNRWLKTGVLLPELKALIHSIDRPMKWIVITEPWCGDAAHNIPFMDMMARENGLITLEFQLRDTEPFLINDYLTNGGKAIPILVMRDSDDNDLAVWGPRPVDCQALYHRLKSENAPKEVMMTEIQKWYNNDKGQQMQEEIYKLLTEIAG